MYASKKKIFPKKKKYKNKKKKKKKNEKIPFETKIDNLLFF